MMTLLMSGARLDVKSVVQEPSHKVLHYQCAAHRLNLTVVSSCKIQAFRNAKSYIGEIARFFSIPQQRDNGWAILKPVIRLLELSRKMVVGRVLTFTPYF